MRVQLLWFAALKDLTGHREETIDLPSAVSTVGALLQFLESTRPELAGRLGACRVAVNEEFVATDASLGGARDVALIPPVSGG